MSPPVALPNTDIMDYPMKLTAVLTALFLVSPMALASSLDLKGVWKLKSGEYINGEGDLISYQSLNMQSLKIISDTHFSFTSMKGDTFWASGTGSYEFEDGKYVEKLQLNSFGEKPGAIFAFDARVEGEYWYNTRWEDGKRVEYEVWQKVE